MSFYQESLPKKVINSDFEPFTDDDLNAFDGVYTTTITPPQDGVDFLIKVYALGEGSGAYVSFNHYVGFGSKTIMENRRLPRFRRDTNDPSDPNLSYGESVLDYGSGKIKPFKQFVKN